MPDLTGLQLVARLRGAGVTLPVALITGSPSADLLGWPASSGSPG